MACQGDFYLWTIYYLWDYRDGVQGGIQENAKKEMVHLGRLTDACLPREA